MRESFVQSENVAAQAIEEMDYPETVFVSFDKPLTDDASRTIECLKARYVDREGRPLVLFETDSLVTLHIPSCGIRKVI